MTPSVPPGVAPSCGMYYRSEAILWCGPYHDATLLDDMARVLAIQCIRGARDVAHWLPLEDLLVVIGLAP